MDRPRSPRNPRVVARCQVVFERMGERVVAVSEDLSRRGVYVRTDELLPVGAVTELEVRLPDDTGFAAFARVAHLLTPSAARALGRHVGMGFEFLAAEGGAEALAGYLDDLIDELTPPPSATSAPARVVVAEPGAPLRARIATALTDAGLEVTAFADGAAAYAACQAARPDGVVAALAMPGLDGAGLLRALAVNPRLEGLPVLLIADEISDHVRLEAYRLGVRDLLTRPFLDEELVIRTRRAVASAGRRAERAVLRGDLAEISVATLLSLFEFERKSGVLVAVAAVGDQARLSVARGRVVKIEGTAVGAGRDHLAAALTWDAGHFEFTAGEIPDADEVGVPTTQLLLELARAKDEAERSVG